MLSKSIRPTLLSLLLLAMVGCVPVEVASRLGYANTRVGGRLALDSGGGAAGSAVEQDIGSAFGLGDRRGSPFYRADVDFGGPVASASILWVRENGQGELDNSFGGLPQNTTVSTRLDVALAKLSAAYEFDLGLVTLAPGVLFDVYALDFSASEPSGSREEIDDVVFVPMPFVRAEAEVGPVSGVVELAYLEIGSLGDNEGRFLDVEAMIEWRPLPLGHLFAGYRMLDIDASGDTGDESFAADLQIRGWTIGGGIRF